eukprot:jgi/Tetstr1/457404/TSEL_044006.t1
MAALPARASGRSVFVLLHAIRSGRLSAAGGDAGHGRRRSHAGGPHHAQSRYRGVSEWAPGWASCRRQAFAVTAGGSSAPDEMESAWAAWLQQNPLPGQRLASEAVQGESTAREQSEAENPLCEGAGAGEPRASFAFRWEATGDIMSRALDAGADLTWDASKLAWRGHCPASAPTCSTASIRLPRLLPPPAGPDPCPQLYLERISAAPGGGVACSPCLIVLLAADSAALGLVDASGRLVRHKVLTGYTVRAKRGKSQLYYMQRGGGAGSVGGRIRAREVKRLFAAVGSKLTEWADDIRLCEQLFHSGDVRVWNEVYSHGMPVGRSDIRWQRLGLSLGKPRFKELERALYILGQGHCDGLPEASQPVCNSRAGGRQP